MSPLRLPKIPPWMKKIFLLTALGTAAAPWFGSFLFLSREGMEHFQLWQTITYLFAYPFPSGLFSMILDLGLIWIFGTSLAVQLSASSLIALYLGSGFVAALSAWGAMSFFSTGVLSGAAPAAYAFLVVWAILNPRSHLFLFFALPLRTRNLLFLLIGVNLLMEAAAFRWVTFCACFGASVFGYLFALLCGKTRSLIPFLEPFETIVLKLAETLKRFSRSKASRVKVYDIHSGEPVLNDDQFMDAMLAKISLHGEEALSRDEKEKMQKISQKLKKR